MADDKMTLEQFGQSVKAKYPQYKDMDDAELANRMIVKYPQYQANIIPSTEKKSPQTTPSATTSPNSTDASQQQSAPLKQNGYEWSNTPTPEQQIVGSTEQPAQEKIGRTFINQSHEARQDFNAKKDELNKTQTDLNYLSNDQTEQLAKLNEQYNSGDEKIKKALEPQIKALENQPYTGKQFTLQVPTQAGQISQDDSQQNQQPTQAQPQQVSLTPQTYSGEDKNIPKIQTVKDAYGQLIDKNTTAQQQFTAAQMARQQYVDARNKRLDQTNLNAKGGFVNGMELASTMNARQNQIGVLSMTGRDDEAMQKANDYLDDMNAMNEKAQEDKVNVSKTGQGFYNFYKSMIEPIGLAAGLTATGNPLLSAAYMSFDAGTSAYTNSLLSNYQKLMQDNPNDAAGNYAKAKQMATQEGLTSGVVMAAGMGAADITKGLSQLNEFAGRSFTKGLSDFGLTATDKTGADLFFSTPKTAQVVPLTLSQMAKHSAVEGGIFGALQAGKVQYMQGVAKHLGLEEPESTEGVANMTAFPFIMNGLMYALGKGGELVMGKKNPFDGLSQDTKTNLVLSASTYQPDAVEQMLTKGVTNGIIKPEQKDALTSEINQTRNAITALPNDLDVETLKKAIPIVRQIQANDNVIGNDKMVDAIRKTAEIKNEGLNQDLHEVLGTPLSDKEQKDYERIKNLQDKEEVNQDGRHYKVPLEQSDKDKLAHYEVRIKQAEANEKAKQAENKGAPKTEEQNVPPQPEGQVNEETTYVPPTDQHVARHGNTIDDERGKVSGGTSDKPLTEGGKADARDTGKEFKEDWDKRNTPQDERVIITSPIDRAQETANKAADVSGAKVVTDENLKDRDKGEFKGVSDEEYEAARKWFAQPENADKTVYKPESGKSVKEIDSEISTHLNKIETDLKNGYQYYDGKIGDEKFTIRFNKDHSANRNNNKQGIHFLSLNTKLENNKGYDSYEDGKIQRQLTYKNKSDAIVKVEEFLNEIAYEHSYPYDATEGKRIGESTNDFGKRQEQVHNDRTNNTNGYTADSKLVTHGENLRMLKAIDDNGGKYDENALKKFAESERQDDVQLSKPKPEATDGKWTDDTTKEYLRLGDEEKEKADYKVTGLDNKTGKYYVEDSKGNRIKEGIETREEAEKLAFGNNEPRTTGISHQAMQEGETETGVKAPQRGEGTTPEEQIEKGRKLLADGADPQKVVDDFNKDGKISGDSMAIVRAHAENLAKAEADAVDRFGVNSPEDKAAKKALEDWQKAIKPMATMWHEVGQTMQGKTDIDTGSFVQLRRAAEEEGGKPLTAKQTEEAKKLSEEVQKERIARKAAEDKLTELMNKAATDKGGTTVPRSYTEKAKTIADKFRQLKTKPLIIKDENGQPINITMLSISPSWNDAIELGAKAIELSGKIADGVQAAVEHLKKQEWYGKLPDESKAAIEKQITEHLSGTAEPEEDISSRFADKKDNKFSSDDAKDIWNYAKREYLDNGSSYRDMVAGVSKDLGLTPEQVQTAIATPKGAKEATEEIFRRQYNERKAMQKAKNWVQTTNQNPILKGLKNIAGFFFEKAIAGHGTVGMITHAGLNLFEPSTWKYYIPRFFEQFKNTFGALGKKGLADYEKRMTDLTLRPNWALANKAGLANDPHTIYDDYGALKKYLGALGTMGDRGFNTIKEFRQDLFDHYYDKLSNVEKSDPNSAKEIAKIANHATGTSKVRTPENASLIAFAPRLEASRWARMYEPVKALNTFAKAIPAYGGGWDNVPASEKAAAKIVARRTGTMLATYAGALAVNQAILSLTGSKQKINFNAPSQSDWMRFKAGDTILDLTGGMVSTSKFLENLIQLAFTHSRKDLKGATIQDKASENVGRYLRGKLAPGAGTAADVFTHHDFEGNTLPFFNDKPLHKDGKKLTWGQYVAKSQTPIPISEAVNDVMQQMKNEGMKEPQIHNVIHGILVGGISGFTGTRVTQANPKEAKK